MTLEPPTPPTFPFQIPNDVPRIYANFVVVQPAGMDMTLAFGHQVGAALPTWSVSVTMSWEEAKWLVEAVQTQLDNYEREFGEVRDVMKTVREAIQKEQSQATPPTSTEQKEGNDQAE